MPHAFVYAHCIRNSYKIIWVRHDMEEFHDVYLLVNMSETAGGPEPR